MLAVVAVLGAWLWPSAHFGIGIILAARYLYAAVQNNIVNYRVIRLAVPMMRELDKLESSPDCTVKQQDLVGQPQILERCLHLRLSALKHCAHP